MSRKRRLATYQINSCGSGSVISWCTQAKIRGTLQSSIHGSSPRQSLTATSIRTPSKKRLERLLQELRAITLEAVEATAMLEPESNVIDGCSCVSSSIPMYTKRRTCQYPEWKTTRSSSEKQRHITRPIEIFCRGCSGGSRTYISSRFVERTPNPKMKSTG